MEQKSTFLCVASRLSIQDHPTDPFSNSFINPDYGWDALNITEVSMQRLLCHLNVFSQFFKYLRAFGTKTYAQDEGFGGFDMRTSVSDNDSLKNIGKVPLP